ncbi:hypothetical protein [Mycobacterium marinum]|uniref:hypothetical protein n=1 Tax=Mycobacterium marinum TaxID=1781 RepID=UPI0011407CCC|nr:hypothetical protein [Mycobacterium marinum]
MKLPRFDFIDEDQHDAMAVSAKGVDEQNPDLALRKRQRLVNLAMLKPFVAQREYLLLEPLPAGQLESIMIIWATESTVPLGELLASADSSTGNTGAPSSTTSTVADGQDATSDAA